MDDRVRLALLMDTYGALLTPRQRQAMELHYQRDWSLSEIGETMGISRQGVLDALKRGAQTLTKLEAALHLLRDRETLGALAQDPSLADGEARQRIAQYLDRIEEAEHGI